MTTKRVARFFLHAAATAAILTAAAPAHAGRPFATEDAGVLEAGKCELEAFGARLTSREAPKETGWWVQPGCGLGLNSQLAVGGGRTKVEGESTTAVALIGKTFIRELTDDRFGVTLAYQLIGEGPPGESLEHAGTDLRAVLSAPLGGVLLHANLGWNRSEVDRINSTTWALAVEVPVGGGLDVGVESYGDDRTAAWLGIGARYALLPDKLFIDMSYALQAASARAKLLTVGLKIVLN
jgi:hypothetical protein